ncbi:MAG: NAD(P)/FAD-dependent oxidoreductase [Erysipelothrix sp.]|nr:NAD(P)/FAD-dependent oxidoreductase [Erysipelothrix sp.]
MNQFDVIVIGGGIVGTNVLRVLSQYQLKSLLLEKNRDIGSGVTKGNGGVVHSGYDASHGTLKAKLNPIGAAMYSQLAKDLDFPYENKGTLTVGFNDEEAKTLEKLLANGQANNVPGLRLVCQQELREIEPNVNPEATIALYAPSAGITDPYEVAYACAENAIANGAQVKVNTPVVDIIKKNDIYQVVTKDEIYEARFVINCAGVYGDHVAKMAGSHDYEIIERHGTLAIIEKAVGFELNATLFPVPGQATKGMAAIPACAGNIILGSTATVMQDKEATRFTKDEATELFESASRLVPGLKRENIIRIFTGLRPVEVHSNNDFVIEEDKNHEGLYHAIGIQSPGIAAAPAIAEYVVELIKEKHSLVKKEDYNPKRKGIVDFSELSVEDKQKLVKENPAYGNVICRCEIVTEGEIVDAIHRPIGATTIDGIKRRTRAGMGRCQGGFCQPKIMEILHRELGVDYQEILLEETGSNVLWEDKKDVR